MKTKKKDLTEIVKKIESPYRNIEDQLKYAKETKELLKETVGLDKYDLSKMMPKVSYDDWMVCLYQEDNKFYYIDGEEIAQVEPIMIFDYDEKYKNYFTNDGKALFGLELRDIAKYISADYLCCGELDDMKKYIVFR